MSVIQSLRCFNCRRFAYSDLFEGNESASGYCCTICEQRMDGKFK